MAGLVQVRDPVGVRGNVKSGVSAVAAAADMVDNYSRS